MKSKFYYLTLGLYVLIAISCTQSLPDIKSDEKKIGAALDQWNLDAASANFDAYFNRLEEDSYFIGTDATERWNKTEFKIWAKPFFDHKKTWNFKSIQRNIYFSTDGNLAWFDELLNTQMKICRGSGVMIRKDGDWKIKQYVLSTTIPNQVLNQIIPIKTPVEDSILKVLK